MSTLRVAARRAHRRQRARVDGAGDVQTNDWSPKSRTSLEPVLAKVDELPQPTLRRRPSTVSSPLELSGVASTDSSGRKRMATNS